MDRTAASQHCSHSTMNKFFFFMLFQWFLLFVQWRQLHHNTYLNEYFRDAFTFHKYYYTCWSFHELLDHIQLHSFGFFFSLTCEFSSTENLCRCCCCNCFPFASANCCLSLQKHFLRVSLNVLHRILKMNWNFIDKFFNIFLLLFLMMLLFFRSVRFIKTFETKVLNHCRYLLILIFHCFVYILLLYPFHPVKSVWFNLNNNEH